MNTPGLACFFLAAGVASVGGGCVGLVRMGSAAARLHFVSAATLAAPPLVMAAVLTQEGLSQAGLKSILIAAVLLAQGPVAAHVLGRAIHTYERQPRSGKAGSPA